MNCCRSAYWFWSVYGCIAALGLVACGGASETKNDLTTPSTEQADTPEDQMIGPATDADAEVEADTSEKEAVSPTPAEETTPVIDDEAEKQRRLEVKRELMEVMLADLKKELARHAAPRAIKIKGNEGLANFDSKYRRDIIAKTRSVIKTQKSREYTVDNLDVMQDHLEALLMLRVTMYTMRTGKLPPDVPGP